MLWPIRCRATCASILGDSASAAFTTQEQAVFSYWRTTVPEWKDENNTIAALWREYPEGSSQLVLDERAQMRTTHQLVRGDFLNPGKEVTPGVPSFLNPLPAGAPVNRLTFAKWMTARDAPTTARAFVNRIWLEYFGIGIVETAEDFGTQSSAAVASGIARLAGCGIHGPQVGREGDAAADRHVGNVPAVFERYDGADFERSV